MSRQTVRIENPAPGGQSKTSMERALRFESIGRAVFTPDGTLWFLDNPPNAYVCRDAQDALNAWNTGYDRQDRHFFDEARNIPVINAEKMIREVKSSRNWSYTAGVFHRERQNEHNNSVRLER